MVFYRLCLNFAKAVGPVGHVGLVGHVGHVGLVSPEDHVGFVLRCSCQAVFRIAQPC